MDGNAHRLPGLARDMDGLWISLTCIYTMFRDSKKAPTWRDLTFSQLLLLDSYTQMTFDGYSHVYVNVHGVHVCSVNGQYVQQLPDGERNVRSMAVDRQRHVLYTGHNDGKVSVFTRPSSN